ncbi:MAG: ABC transporter substrate-binding protein [Gallionellaceae bacterium]|jgi:branched-chain amino acid transport system substrate-binding protein
MKFSKMLATKLFIFSLLSLTISAFAAGSTPPNIKIAIDAEFGIPGSTSAQAVYNGAQVAVNEINASGGLLGRKLELVNFDNRALPARSLNNIREIAADSNFVAVMCGKYSPAVIEILPEIQLLKLPLLDPWAAADKITEISTTPNYVFRLSLRDSWALQVMMRHAQKIGALNVGILLPNTAWGRSSLRAAEQAAIQDTRQKIVSSQWYNWGDQSLLEQYQVLRSAGAQAIILVANEKEGVILIKEIAALPQAEHLPVVAHWGLSGGDFFAQSGEDLAKVDLSIVQTYTFIGKTNSKAKQVLAGLKIVTGSDDPRKVVSPVGVAHAYDLVHLLAMAIRQAKSTDRERIRNALEKLGAYQGLVRNLNKPFSAKDHDALTISEVFMARYAEDGAIEPLGNFKP